jgi:hypothetical protein
MLANISPDPANGNAAPLHDPCLCGLKWETSCAVCRQGFEGEVLNTENTEGEGHLTQRTQRTQDIPADHPGGVPTHPGYPALSVLSRTEYPLEAAILATVPTGPGKRHRAVFDLARGLKALPHLADASLADLKPIVRRWHRLALATIRTKPFEDTWLDFALAWELVKFPAGSGPLDEIFALALAEDLPPAALAYEEEGVCHLVALCYQLQQHAGADPFFLGCRTAGKVLGVSHVTAWGWLRVLQFDGVLALVRKGTRASGKASEWRFNETGNSRETRR